MRKKFFLFFFISFNLFNIFSLDINDFTVFSRNNKTSIMITESKEKILSDFRTSKVEKRELENSCENYLIDTVDIIFLGKKIISIELESKKYKLASNVKNGDKVKKIYKIYGEPDFKGDFSDGNCFIDYYLIMETNSPWKQPQYTMRFIYNSKKINKIVLFYTE